MIKRSNCLIDLRKCRKRLSMFVFPLNKVITFEQRLSIMLTVSTKNGFPNKKFKSNLSLKGWSEEIRLRLVTQDVICWVILKLHSSVLVQLIFPDWYASKLYFKMCVVRMVQILQFEWSFLRDPYKQIRFAKQGRNTQFW